MPIFPPVSEFKLYNVGDRLGEMFSGYAPDSVPFKKVLRSYLEKLCHFL